MSAIEKVLAATLKDISTALHIIGAGSALELLREYSIVKANYFYEKVEEDIEEQLAKIDQMIEVNNVANGRKVAVTTAYLRDVTIDWYKADKININHYIDNNSRSFIR